MKQRRKSRWSRRSALLVARQSLFHFASVTHVDPRGTGWRILDQLRTDRMVSASAALLRDEAARRRSLSPHDAGPLVRLDPRRVVAALPTSRSSLVRDYEGTFEAFGEGAWSPCESPWRWPHDAAARRQCLRELRGIYAQVGMLSLVRAGIPADHLLVECECEARLNAARRYAHAQRTRAGIRKVHSLQRLERRFYREHLATWLAPYAEHLQHVADGVFYVRVADFLSALAWTEGVIRSAPGERLVDAPSEPVRQVVGIV